MGDGLPAGWLRKPERRATVKARGRREWDRRRTACEDEVWVRDHGRCRHCHRPVLRPATTRAWIGRADVGHVHEWPMRSAQNDGTDPRLAFLLCAGCHLKGCHGWPRLEPAYEDPEAGAYGSIAWTWRRSKVEWRGRDGAVP